MVPENSSRKLLKSCDTLYLVAEQTGPVPKMPTNI